MSDNQRDTQFLAIAELLIKEQEEVTATTSMQHIRRMVRLRFAQRIYDTVQHTIGHTLEYLHECGNPVQVNRGKEIQPTIPDIAHWSDYGFKE